MKSTFIFCSYLTLLMISDFCFAFDEEKTENYLDKILRYELNFKEQEKQLSDVINEISKQIERDKENPYLWYLKGRSSWAALYVYDKADVRHKEFKKLIPVEYEKALALNEKSKVLTEDQLHNMHGSYSVLVKAARQYIDLKKQKTTLQKKEHLRLLRETIISALIKQNKFEEAYQEMAYIDNHFPENAQGETGNIAWRQHFEKEIELQKNKIAEAEQEETTQATESKKSEPAIANPQLQPVQQQPVVKAEGTPKKQKSKPEANNNQAIIIGIVLVVLLMVGFMIARRKLK